jgi:hypothetical protein
MGFYWSSTENSVVSAWKQDFVVGGQIFIFKYLEWRVRPVRAF